MKLGLVLSLIAVLLVSAAAWQDSPSVYDNALFTRVAVLETRVGEIVPTQEIALTAAPSPSPTPDPFVQACVRGGINLIVRDAPGGKRVGILPGGTYVRYLPDSAQAASGFVFVRLDTSGLPGQPPEWVASDFLEECGD